MSAGFSQNAFGLHDSRDSSHALAEPFDQLSGPCTFIHTECLPQCRRTHSCTEVTVPKRPPPPLRLGQPMLMPGSHQCGSYTTIASAEQ